MFQDEVKGLAHDSLARQ